MEGAKMAAARIPIAFFAELGSQLATEDPVGRE